MPSPWFLLGVSSAAATPEVVAVVVVLGMEMLLALVGGMEMLPAVVVDVVASVEGGGFVPVLVVVVLAVVVGSVEGGGFVPVPV